MRKKLKKIMKVKDREERGIKLKEYASELGCSLQGISVDGRLIEEEVVNRILNAERSKREHNLWVIALLSSAASLLSAIAAWIAILK